MHISRRAISVLMAFEDKVTESFRASQILHKSLMRFRANNVLIVASVAMNMTENTYFCNEKRENICRL